MISILVVDDSAFMRKALRMILERDPEIQVIAAARDGEEALDMIRQHNPDVVTLDIEMPRMDGLTCLKRIMTEMPRPVLMVSSLTSEGAEATLKALEYGAVDFIVKQQMGFGFDLARLEKDLAEKIKTVARRRSLRRPVRPLTTPASPSAPSTSPGGAARPAAAGTAGTGALPRSVGSSGAANFVPAAVPSGRPMRDLVVIGVSTGGPPAVQKVLSALPQDFPAGILIAQHMPAAFTGPFAKRLDSLCAISVKEAEDGDRIKPGTAYIAPGGKHIRVAQKAVLEVQVSTNPEDALYKPSANVLIESAGIAMARRTLGAIFTGMGSDGLEGVKVLKAKGGRALAQSDATCVVYGMPKAIVDAGLADEIVDIDDMALAIQVNLYK